MANRPNNDDGRPSIDRVGLRHRGFGDLYHELLQMSWLRLIVVVISLYVVANLFFAEAYLAFGDGIENARPGSFWDVFFFSVQTMATIGYGKLVPVSLSANLLMTCESLLGLLGFAVMTGLIFAKFARPTAKVMFCEKPIFTYFEGVPSLMLRMANERESQIVEAQVRVVVMRTVRTAEGVDLRRVKDLKLVRSSNAFFSLSWTVIHEIENGSPFHGLTPEVTADSDLSLAVSVTGIEEITGQTVHARRWYTGRDIVWDMRFADILQRGADGKTVVDYNRFNELVPVQRKLLVPLGTRPAEQAAVG